MRDDWDVPRVGSLELENGVRVTWCPMQDGLLDCALMDMQGRMVGGMYATGMTPSDVLTFLVYARGISGGTVGQREMMALEMLRTDPRIHKRSVQTLF